MAPLLRTPLFRQHESLGAKFVPFGGWEMPLSYPRGILQEHLATRGEAGLFDISHMGRFLVRGRGALPFLQHVLTNQAEALEVDRYQAQYTLIPNERGGAVDDAYLYRLGELEYLLVVNAANREKDREHLLAHLREFPEASLVDATPEIAMLALQGPRSRELLERVLEAGRLPEPLRNEMSSVRIAGAAVTLSRTGYTGEPLGFELFVETAAAAPLWERLVAEGAIPAGLGARDTLRLEAGLPLYGRELGRDPGGAEIPIFALPMAKLAVSFSPRKGDYVGREALAQQQAAYLRIVYRDYSLRQDLPRLLQPVAVTGSGVPRAGDRLLRDGRHVGYVTSGTRVPSWTWTGEGLQAKQTKEHELRSLALAYVDCDLVWDDRIDLEVRGRLVEGFIVEYHLRSDAPPYARPVRVHCPTPSPPLPVGSPSDLCLGHLRRTLRNTRWRQRECVNLIPSEMTTSPLTRLSSVLDPAFRYAEHKQVEAFCDAEVYYYQGTDFIRDVEGLLARELSKFLGAREVETRVLSGQMANAAVFSALVDYRNRANPKAEPGRIRQVLHHHLIRGGHLSAQPMGALHEHVARDPRNERAAVREFPVLAENPYRVDVPKTLELIDRYRPELIVFGKSVFLHREPIAEIRRFVDDQGFEPVLLYDGAHVLGLLGPHFQEPFAEGADLITGSTHKTFFGTQRGLVASRYEEHEERYELWEALQRRTFPGSVSNHHLGTQVGLLVAACEMAHFRDEYQPRVIANAKAFARALRECGLEVAGDPSIGYTETHQVLVNVGYGRAPDLAARLEGENVLCNYQGGPDEEGFTAAGSLRLGVAEMTRFGMAEADFGTLAELVAEVLLRGARARDRVKALRERFSELRYCFKGGEWEDLLDELRSSL
jgi:aminomethyltransferase